jgi:hypothetical protein
MKNISVLIVNEKIDHKGIIANVSFVLGLTAGRELLQETFGTDVVDGDDSIHKYLTNIGHYVRKAGQNKIKTIRKEFLDAGIMVVDYTDDAAPADYATYTESIKSHKAEEIIYRAIWVYGPEEIVLLKTKNLSSLQ